MLYNFILLKLKKLKFLFNKSYIFNQFLLKILKKNNFCPFFIKFFKK